MNKLEHVREVYDEEIARIKRPELWQHTLESISKYYKFNFVEALLIHAQAEQTTTLAVLKVWNKYGRYIRAGERSTAVFTSRTDTKLKYLFDISQTYGKPIAERWDLRESEEQRETLLRRYNAKHGTNYTDIVDVLDDVYRTAIKSISDDIETEINIYQPQNADIIRNLIKDSAFVMIMSRCGYEVPEDIVDFSAISEVVPDGLLVSVGNLSMKAAHEALLEIENAIRRKDYEHQIQRNGDRVRGEGRIVLSETGSTQGERGAEHKGKESSGHAEQSESLGSGRGEHQRSERQDMGGNSGQSGPQGSGDHRETSEGLAAGLERKSGEGTGDRSAGGTSGQRTDERTGSAIEKGGDDAAALVGRSGVAAPVSQLPIEYEKEESSEIDGSFSIYDIQDGEAYVKIIWSESNEFKDGEILPFAEANRKFAELDSKQRLNREADDWTGSWYDKTRFTVYSKIDGNEYEYTGRYDIGDGDGTLLNHIAGAKEADRDFLALLESISKKSEEKISEADNKKDEISEVISFVPTAEEKYLQETFFAAENVADEQEEAVKQVLQRGSLFENGKNRIEQFYREKGTDTKAFAALLKKEYGIGGYSGSGNVKWVNFDGKGIEIEFTDNKVTLNWNQAAKRIGELIDRDEYLVNHKTQEISDKSENISNNEQPENPDLPTNQIMRSVTAPMEKDGALPQEISAIYKKNFHVNQNEKIDYAEGEKAKFRDNVAAIRTLRKIEKEKRYATQEEQKILSKYVGWGGLSKAFDQNAENWQKEYIELKALLSEKEYEAALESTLTAYYTDPALVRPIYEVLERFGFKGGEILDPAAGTGNFFSVIPESIADNSRLHGIELDSITGRITRLLYPDADIKVQGFEYTSIDNDTFDIAVGNVPFANFKIDDREYDEEYLLHDYFFIKSLDKLKPGGIAAFITSTGTLDKHNNQARIDMANRAEFIGAVRLPDNAFKAIAGTEVTTDIIFLKKREQQQSYSNQSGNLPLWAKAPGSIYNAQGMFIGTCNQYYHEHPEMVLGEQKLVQGRFGPEMRCKAADGIELTAALRYALKSFQAEYTAKPTEITEETIEDVAEEKLPAPEDSRNFCFYINESDELFYRENEYIIPFSASKKSEGAIKAMCGLCGRLQKVIDIQLKGEYSDNTLHEAQKALSEDYDKFVKKFGYLNANENVKLFHEDIRSSLLLSLEEETDDTVNTGEYRKADIFTKATIAPQKQIERAESSLEALEISLNVRNKVDIPYMASLCGKSEDAVISDLGNRIYQNPAEYDGSPYSGWETAEEYLSGYVKDKLGIAMQFAKEYPDLFERNVPALEENQPSPLSIADIDFSVGAVFIPAEMYRDFMYELFETPIYKRVIPSISQTFRTSVNIEYSSLLNQWKITNKGSDVRLQVNEVYGTKRINAYEIFEYSLNQKKVTVKDPVEYYNQNGEKAVKYVINKNETHIARMRQTKIEAEFKKWLLAEPERVHRVEKIYNDRFNNIKVRKYDGSYIRLQGLNPLVKLRPHQLNVIARIAAGNNVMLAHEVGAGKTAAMAGAGMYLKSIGAAKKPLYVVPKPIVAQWGREFARFFPLAKVLVTDEKDFEKKNRRRFLSKIATGDYDAIVMSQSQFERIPLSFERQEKFLQEKKSQLVQAKEKARIADGKSAFTVKQFASAIKNIEKKLTKLQANFKKDDFINFEALGCDYLFVDEAHAYKNLFTPTKHTNVAGINSSADSQRAFDMEMKTAYINEINGGGGVVMATGTPISNSIAECYVFQHFLQRPILQKMGVDSFDEWASVFGNIVTALEVKPTGSGWRMRERFSEFKNLPELCNALSQCFDVVKTSEIAGINLPEIIGGKPECVVCEQSEEQAEQVEIGMKRAELIETGAVNATQDNMLAVCSYMTKVSLDPRINDSAAEDWEGLKVNVCAEEILQIDKQHPNSAQVVFCDTSTPKNNEDFTVYKALKERLLKSGQYKPEEIVFVHDAKNDRQRLELFDKVNNAAVKVIIGSTSKLGTGVNMQQKLIAVHHLDAPYVPKDVEQRNGRIIRQGNENKQVYVKYYSTKGTFDSYRWQLLEKKQRLIAQILSGKPPARSCQDIDETALTFAEMKAAASDNPLIAEKMQIDNEVDRLKLLQHDWLDQQARYKYAIECRQPMNIENLQKRIGKLSEDIELMQKNQLGKDDFAIEVGNSVYTARSDAGKALISQWGRYMNSEQHKSFSPSNSIGRYRGFEISFHENGTTPIVRLTGKSGLIYTNDFSMTDVGICIRIENLVNGIPGRKESTLAEIQESEKELEIAKQQYGKPFEYAEELDKLLLRQTEINGRLELGTEQEVIIDESDEEAEEMEMI